MSDRQEKEIKKLVKQAKNGGLEAFGIIYELFAERIYRYIYLKISDKDEAEDLTQQVFIKAWEALPDFRFKKNPFSSWLYSIARNLITDFYRKKKPIFSLDAEIKIDVPDAADLNEQLMIKEKTQKVFRAIQQLPDEQKELLILRFVDEFSYNEIAKIMRKSPLTLRVLQHRALKRLRTIINNNY